MGGKDCVSIKSTISIWNVYFNYSEGTSEKEREQQQLQEKEHYYQGETPIRKMRSLLNCLRGRQER